MTERRERSTALDRHQADPAPPRSALTDRVPAAPRARLPRLAVAAWAGGRTAAPAGRRGKKVRRRARRIAAALAAILVSSTFGGTAALADPSFYEASPHVGNAELVDAGSQTFDRRLAIGEPESTGGDAIAARTLEDAILTGGLSPDDMEMPDMMLAGISGDQMALAAAQDDDASPGVGPAAGSADGNEPAGVLAQAGADAVGGTASDRDDATGPAGKGPVTDATVDELTRDAAGENPDGFASPALGGDPEPIVEEYAAVSLPEEAPPAEDPAPVGPEMASADTGGGRIAPVSVGEAAGTEPTSETGTESGAEPAKSDELAYTPVSDDRASEDAESTDPAPEEAAPAETEPEEPATDGSAPEGYDAADAPTSTPAPASEEESSPPEFASAENGRPDDGYSYMSETSGGSEASEEAAPPQDAPPEDAAAQENTSAELAYLYNHEEEAEDHNRGSPPEHSSAGGSSAEHGASRQDEVHQSDTPDEGAREQAEWGRPEEVPPILEEDAGLGSPGQADTGPKPAQDDDAAGTQGTSADAQEQGQTVGRPEEGDQTFSGGGSSAAPGQTGRPESFLPQEHGPQEGPQADAPAGPGDPAREGDGAAHDLPQDAPQQTEQEEPQDGPQGRNAPDEATGGESGTNDELRAAPKDGAARATPTWDRRGIPEDGRPRDRAAEDRAAHRPDPAADERVREDRRVERIAEEWAERREERQAERQAALEARRRAERQEFQEDRRAERLAQRQAERRAKRQADPRAERGAERQAAQGIAAQQAAAHAAAQEAAGRAALRQQLRTERAAQEAAVEVEGFTGTGARRSLPSARRWDAPAVESQLPAGRGAAREWSQPLEPVAVQPASQKPAPLRFAGGGHAARGAAEASKGVMR